MRNCKNLEQLINQGVSWCSLKEPCFPNCEKCKRFEEMPRMKTASARICQTTTLTGGGIAVTEFEPGSSAPVGSYTTNGNGDAKRNF